MAPTKNQIKEKIERLKDYMISHFESVDSSDNVIYYQGYTAGYVQAIEDALDLFD